MWSDEAREAAAAARSKSGAKPAKPIPNSPYHAKSDAELRYIIKDASEAEQASRGMTAYNPNGGQRTDTNGKYADQVNDAATVLGYRDRGGLSDHPDDVAARAASAGGAKSDKVPTHSAMSGSGTTDAAGIKSQVYNMLKGMGPRGIDTSKY
jgi:hypothetical protein